MTFGDGNCDRCGRGDRELVAVLVDLRSGIDVALCGDCATRAADRDSICDGCGASVERCGPTLWIQARKCCPDCSHDVHSSPELGAAIAAWLTRAN